MPKVPGADKAVNSRLKPEVQVKREGMSEPLPMLPTQSHIIHPVQSIELPVVGQKRVGHTRSHTASTYRS